MKKKIVTQRKFIQVVSGEKLDCFLKKTFGYVFDSWHMHDSNVYHVTGKLDFMQGIWNDFKSAGERDGLDPFIILNGLAHEGYLPKGIFFVT